MIKKIKTKYKIILTMLIITSIIYQIQFIISALIIGITYYISLGKIIKAKKTKYFDEYLKKIGKDEVNIYIIKSKYPNAFNMGRNIFFTTEFIKKFKNQPEIMYATLGHELGHYTEKHQIIILIYSLIYIGITKIIEGNIQLTLKTSLVFIITLIITIWILEIRADLYSASLSKDNIKGLIEVLSKIKRISLLHPPASLRIKILRRIK